MSPAHRLFGSAMKNSPFGEVERHRVGGIGLQLERVRAGRGGGIDDRQRALERLVVVAGHLGDDERRMSGPTWCLPTGIDVTCVMPSALSVKVADPGDSGQP